MWTLKRRSSHDLHENHKNEKLISNTLSSYPWEQEARKEAVVLNKLAYDAHSKFLSSHGLLSGKRHINYEKALHTFLESIK